MFSENDDLPVALTVDDDDMMFDLVENALDGAFRVLGATDGEGCLAVLDQNKVDLVLLDVEMPGIDGYETCRRIRSGEHAEIPIIFISSHEAIESRISGYEAGGDDYVIKPFDGAELRRKVINLLRLHRERNQHKEMASYASKTAMTAMTSLGEMGALIESMKRFNGSNTLGALADAVLEGLALYGLTGAVQIRTAAETLTRTDEGEAPPLVVSIVNHMKSMDRISFFKSRMCITYEWLSLFVNNMPEDDPERYGRLRDHLAIMAEGGNVRVQAIMMSNALDQVVVDLTKTLTEIADAQSQSRTSINAAVDKLNEMIARVFLSLGLSEGQEDRLAAMIRASVDGVLEAESAGQVIQGKMSALIQELKKLSRQR